MTRVTEISTLLFERNIPGAYLWDDETLAKLDRDYVILTDPKPSAVLSGIRELVTKAHGTISSLDGFSYEVPSRDTDEAEFEPNLQQMCLKRGKVRKYDFGTPGSARRATILTAVLSFIQEGLLNNISIFGPTLFYRDPELFGKPEVVDDAVFDICCMLRCSRGHLGVHASSRGFFIGGVTLVMKDGNPISGRPNSKESVQVPVHTENIIEIVGEISYVLVVEKPAVFHHLVQQRYHDKNNCVIVTGSGEPDMSTRSFVFKLSKITPTPTIYGLFDADPYRATIYCTYRFGPARLSIDNFIHDMDWSQFQ